MSICNIPTCLSVYTVTLSQSYRFKWAFKWAASFREGEAIVRPSLAGGESEKSPIQTETFDLFIILTMSILVALTDLGK